MTFDHMTERRQAEEALRESEERLQRTMESLVLAQRASDSGVWDWNMTTGEAYVSPEYRRLFGISDDEPVTFDRWLAAVYEDDRPAMEAAGRRLFESGTDWNVEFRIVHPKSGLRWLTGIGQLKRDAAGRPRRFSGVTLDITGRKQAERRTRLLANEALAATAKFRAVFYQSETFAGIMNLEGRVIEANRSCLDACGYRAEEVLGLHVWETPWWRGSQEVQIELQKAMRQVAQGSSYRKELPYWWANGAERLVDFTLHPILDEQSRVMFLHLTGVDITRSKRRESNLAFLADVQEAFSRVSSADEIMRVVTEKIAAYLRLSRCLLVEIDEETRQAHVLYDQADTAGPNLIDCYSIKEFHTEDELRRLSAGRTVAIADVKQGSRSKEAADKFAALEVGAITNAPYVSHGRWTFVLSAVHRAPHQWQDDEVELLTELSARTCLRLERARAEETLRARERQLKLITDTAPLCIAHCDREGRHLFVNHSYAERFDVRAEECAGKTIAEIVGSDAYAKVHTYVERALAGESVEFEVEMPFAKIGLRHMHCHYVPERRSDGSVQGLVAVISDITSRITMEAALRATEARYRNVFEHAAMGVAIKDMQGRIIECNPAYSTLLGYTQEELSRTMFTSLVHPDDQARTMAEIRRLLDEELPFLEIENRYVHKDGRPIWVQKFVSLLRDDKGAPVYLVALVTDVTVRRRLEMSLGESQERLRSFAKDLEVRVEERTQELVQSQARLRALATELNLAEQRERKRLARELHDYLAQLLVLGRLKLGQVRRTGIPSQAEARIRETEEVLGQALDYSRTLMAELSPPVLQEHGLPAGLMWLGGQMHRHGLMVKVEVDDVPSLSLPEESAVLLFQSVRELLMNVLKHADSHKVLVRLHQVEQRLCIEVRDDGVGFDLAAASAAAAGDAPTTMSSKFGLFSIRERMTALGGWLDVQSAPGIGTTATLVLPLGGEAAAQRVMRNEELGISGKPSDHSTLHIPHSTFQQDTKQIRVLLVDDHAMVRQGLRSVLDSYPDIEVVGEAWNGEEAVACAERFHPSIIVMDINMPKMNGIEATRLIKERRPETIVIGISVQAGGANETAMKQAGAAILLTKEAAVDELYRAIQTALNGR